MGQRAIGTGAESRGTVETVARIPRVQEAGLPVLARVLLEICVVGAACLRQLGPDNAKRRRRYSAAVMSHLLCASHLSLATAGHAEVTVQRKLLNFLWWLKIKLKATRRPSRLFCF